jgi:hypothetical protein
VREGNSGFVNAAGHGCAWRCPKMRKPKNLGRQALNKRSDRPRLKACDAQNMGHNRPHAVGFPIRDIGEAIRKIGSVKNVTNELTVGGKSSLAARSNDTLITTNVKTRFLGAKGFSSNHVKIVTEASIVYLLGIVTKEEGDAAAEVARTTSGVSRVIKVFEYVDKAPKR